MRVVVAEDQALLREGIVALLREQGIEVVAQAEDAPGLLRVLAGHKPDLAIVDVRLPPTFTDEGVRAALEARTRYPGLGVLILSQYVEPVYTAELLDSGEGGIGDWSEKDIAYALQSGFTPDFDSLGGSMTDVVSNMAHLTEADRAAIAAYLKAIPPHANGYKTQ